MPNPYPGQDWKHGWKPISPAAKVSKNHGRPVPGSKSPKSGGDAKSSEDAHRRSGQASQGERAIASAPTKAAAKPAGKTSAKPAGRAAQAPKKAAPTGKPAGKTKGKEFLDEHYGEWRNNLSPAQEKAMRFYQSPGFALMNGQLRGLDRKDIKADVSFNDSDLERARKASKDLASAIRKAPPLAEPMTVHRGFSADQFGELKAGQILSDKGFVSTSLTADVGSVGKANKPATAEILLPEGTKAAAGSSREMVLPPGSKFRVLDTSTRNGIPHVRMELVL